MLVLGYFDVLMHALTEQLFDNIVRQRRVGKQTPHSKQTL
jgi:hypothetical protein